MGICRWQHNENEANLYPTRGSQASKAVSQLCKYVLELMTIYNYKPLMFYNSSLLHHANKE